MGEGKGGIRRQTRVRKGGMGRGKKEDTQRRKKGGNRRMEISRQTGKKISEKGRREK